MQKRIIVAATLLSAIFLVNNAQVKYDAEKFHNAKKMHKNLVETEPNWIIQHDIDKVLISECVGHFKGLNKFENKSINGVSSPKEMAEYYVKKYNLKNVVSGETYPETVCNLVYERFIKLFYDNGIGSATRTALINNPTYAKIKLKKDEINTFNGTITNAANNITATASGTSNIPMFNSPNEKDPIYNEIGSIANDNDAKAAIKIYFEVEVGENNEPILKKFEVTLDTWMSPFKKGSVTIYKWKVKDGVLFTLDKEVTGNADGTYSLTLFNNELTGMLTSITEMFSFSVSAGL